MIRDLASHVPRGERMSGMIGDVARGIPSQGKRAEDRWHEVRRSKQDANACQRGAPEKRSEPRRGIGGSLIHPLRTNEDPGWHGLHA